jgi:DNA-binding transcriptional ArsR family regulator
MDTIYDLQADVLKTLANPRRLQIIHRLADGPSDVGRLAEQMGIAQPNLSQHLALMRAAGIVEAERMGREVRYRLADRNIVTACGLMREVLERRVMRLADATRQAAADREAQVSPRAQITLRTSPGRRTTAPAAR